MTTALNELESNRDQALEELKDLSLKLRSLYDEEERFLKENRARRFEIEKAKSKVGARVLAATSCLDRLAAKIPREIVDAIATRTAKIGADEFQLREHKRDLEAHKWNMKQLVAQKASSHELSEIRGQLTHLEVEVADLEDDLEEQKKGLAAAEALKREALEALEPEAKKELEALHAPA